MLSPNTIEIVKSTAPLLAEEGKNITTLFYQKLFENHPELKNIFNMTNQVQGEQSRALAESIFMYATHIEKLGPAVNRIAQKHASLQIAPDHYPIVGKYLLEAIQDHLCLEANDPVLDAWAEAYQQLAGIFVQTEEEIYKANEEKVGGWRGFRPFIISNIVQESFDIKSFYLEPEDGMPIAEFQPGQYIGVKTQPTTSDYDEIRQYSLSNAPGEKYYRITVKAEASGTPIAGQVSNYLHNANFGDQVFLQPPTGDFVINDSEKNLVLVAGGVGITPVLSMPLDQVKQANNLENLVFIHCCRDKGHHVMEKELRTLSKETGFTYHVAYEYGECVDHTGYLNDDILKKWLGDPDQDVYFCGPKPFMTALHILLNRLGYSEDQLNYETFGPSIKLN